MSGYHRRSGISINSGSNTRSSSRLHGHNNHVSSQSNASTPSGILLNRLHSLLGCLAESSKIIRKWSSSDTESHATTTNRLIESIHRIRQAVKDVEDRSVVRLHSSQQGGDSERDVLFKQRLREYQVPLDLLELMDYGHDASQDNGYNLFGLNPECFLRGLLREALRQLSGLKRRKVALEMLGNAIEEGIVERDIVKKQQSLVSVVKVNEENTKTSREQKVLKRARDEMSPSSEFVTGEDGDVEHPLSKKLAP